MLSIIVIHCSAALQFAPIHSLLCAIVVTPFKFGTIGFFIISGFLLGERVDRRNPVDYFLRRVKRIFFPWTLWFSMLCVAIALHHIVFYRLEHAGAGRILEIFLGTVSYALFGTTFWFVPNLLFCIAILLIFRRYLYSPALGAALFAANLVYVVNIYAGWFYPGHNHAIFGFVFYLWLGSYASQNFAQLSGYVSRIPLPALVVLAVVTGIAGVCEARILESLHSVDPMNTLRLSNQLFSVTLVLIIFRFKRATWPNFVDVRRNTFGIYLSHGMALMFITYLMRRIPFPHVHSALGADVAGVALWFAVSSATYASCLLVSRWLAGNPSLQWMVGLATEDPAPKTTDVMHLPGTVRAL